MKKTTFNILKSRRIIVNEYGQLLYVKGYSIKEVPKFLHLFLIKGS